MYWELLEHRKDIRVQLSEEDSAILQQMSAIYLKLLRSCGEHSTSAQKMGACILSFAKERLEGTSVQQETNAPRGSLLCRRFVALISQVNGQHRDIGWFADKSVTAEIKVRLIYGDNSVAQIASELEFGSSSLLCKYFKAQTGLTPLQYRKDNKV